MGAASSLLPPRRYDIHSDLFTCFLFRFLVRYLVLVFGPKITSVSTRAITSLLRYRLACSRRIRYVSGLQTLVYRPISKCYLPMFANSVQIKFSPALSESKRNAIDQLGFGTQNRVYLTFNSIFWNSEMHAFHCCSDARFQFFNLSPYGISSHPFLFPFSFPLLPYHRLTP